MMNDLYIGYVFLFIAVVLSLTLCGIVSLHLIMYLRRNKYFD